MFRELTDRVLAYAQAHGITTEPYPTPLAGLKLACQYAPTQLAPVMYEPIVCLVLQGSKQAVLGDGPVSFKQGDAAVIGLDLPTESRIVQASPTKPYLALALKLDMALIRELYSELNPSPSAPETALAISAAEANASLIDAMRRLFGLIARPAATQVLQPLLMREIHYWLLCAGQGAMLRALAQSASHASQIAQAMARIRENFSSTLTVSEMAKKIGMSVSGFHQHFRTVTGTSPLQYQKRLRLMEARRLLQTHSVSSAAFSVGYESATQFSREYSRMFGLPPQRHRSTGTALAADDTELLLQAEFAQ